MALKSSITTANGKGKDNVPLVRPANGWNYQYVTTSPGEMLTEEFLKPLGLSQNRLAMSIRVPSTRIGEIVRGTLGIVFRQQCEEFSLCHLSSVFQSRQHLGKDGPQKLALWLSQPGLPTQTGHVAVCFPRLELPRIDDLIPLAHEEPD